MSKRTKRGIAFSVIVALTVGLGVYVAMPGRTAAQALSDIGKFRVGSALGEERVGFSGRTKVTIFAGGADATALAACLTSPQVEEQMAEFFTGVLVDETTEPEVEQDLRERDGMRVVVRGLQGQVLGLLPAGFTCDELVALLARVRAASTRAVEKSPIYVNLLERPAEVADWLLAEGKTAEVAKYAAFMEELEGKESAVVKTVNARLGK